MQIVQNVDMDEQVKSIVDSLQEYADQLDLKVKIHGDHARRENGWVYLPVRIVGEMGAWERAERLQDLEDKWQQGQDNGDIHLLLIPAAA